MDTSRISQKTESHYNPRSALTCPTYHVADIFLVKKSTSNSFLSSCMTVHTRRPPQFMKPFSYRRTLVLVSATINAVVPLCLYTRDSPK